MTNNEHREREQLPKVLAMLVIVVRPSYQKWDIYSW